jgi:hypothetical protein
VAALAPGPEHADEHKKQPDRVSNATHVTILGVGEGQSTVSALFVGRSSALSAYRRRKAAHTDPGGHESESASRAGTSTNAGLELRDAPHRSSRPGAEAAPPCCNLSKHERDSP